MQTQPSKERDLLPINSSKGRGPIFGNSKRPYGMDLQETFDTGYMGKPIWYMPKPKIKPQEIKK